jgi:hydrogenase maturation protein HypF
VGGHFKNAVAILIEDKVFLSQHIGDMETPQAFEAFQRTIETLGSIYEFQPDGVACDAHPDYISSQYARSQARSQNLPVFSVQHHYAHVLACMAENQIDPPVLGVAWDGTGYGLDQTIWGGEFLQVSDRTFERVATMRSFRLPGGEKAVKEPRRVALGLLYELFNQDWQQLEDHLNHADPIAAFAPRELQILKTMLQKELNAPVTSSVGRLFDAIASLIGLRQTATFEGQAAMELEFALLNHNNNHNNIDVNNIDVDAEYPFEIQTDSSNIPNSPLIIDWAPMIQQILADVASGQPIPQISIQFHNTLVSATVAIAKQVGIKQVVLTGGCFQNKYLTERLIQKLTAENFRPYWHQWVPPNDGGIALGQIVAALQSRS